MNRSFFVPSLTFLIVGCGEPHRVYDDNAAIPKDSAVYRLSEELKRQPRSQSTRAPDRPQEIIRSTSVQPANSEVSQPHTNNDSINCSEVKEASCHSNFIDRDADWADPVEKQIREALSSVPNISTANIILVRCGRTRCEATGRIYSQIPEFSKEESYSYLEEMMFSDRLADANAIPVEVRIARPSEEFTVVFERVRQ